MYSPGSVGGSLESVISLRAKVETGQFSFVIYNYEDSDLIGYSNSSNGGVGPSLCPLFHLAAP